MAQTFLNNARGVLAESISTGETLIKLKDHANIPTGLASGDYFLLTLFRDTTRYGENLEVVKVTAITAGTDDQLNLTVERGYEYPAQIHTAGARLEARLTAQSLRDLLAEANTHAEAYADPAGTADQAVTDHEAATDPHPQYEHRVQHNTGATAAPTATDDESAGYAPRSLWFDTSVTPPEAYRCMDAAAGAAVWVKTTLTLDELGSAATADASALRDRSTHTGTQPLSTISDAGTAAAKNTGTADAELPTVAGVRSTFEIFAPDPERRAVEAATSGAATIERTPNGQSCYMWIVSKGRAEDLAPGGQLGSGVHEAFLVNGAEKSHFLFGMYPAALVNGEAVSQPGRIPWVSSTFDATRDACAALGAGWHQASAWEWAYIALWCMANGYQPTGNTNWGRSHANVWETAARGDNGQPGVSSGDGKHYAGYGPNAWNHNAGANGIADLVGLVWERLNLMKLVEGRVFLADDNDHALAETAWADTLFDMPTSRTWSTIDATGASDKLKRALVVPNGVLDPEGYLYTTLTGERIPLRGGYWYGGGNAGLGALFLRTDRSGSSSSIGLRLARAI